MEFFVKLSTNRNSKFASSSVAPGLVLRIAVDAPSELNEARRDFARAEESATAMHSAPATTMSAIEGASSAISHLESTKDTLNSFKGLLEHMDRFVKLVDTVAEVSVYFQLI